MNDEKRAIFVDLENYDGIELLKKDRKRCSVAWDALEVVATGLENQTISEKTLVEIKKMQNELGEVINEINKAMGRMIND